jgi:hypothetical protein
MALRVTLELHYGDQNVYPMVFMPEGEITRTGEDTVDEKELISVAVHRFRVITGSAQPDRAFIFDMAEYNDEVRPAVSHHVSIHWKHEELKGCNPAGLQALVTQYGNEIITDEMTQE